MKYMQIKKPFHERSVAMMEVIGGIGGRTVSMQCIHCRLLYLRCLTSAKETCYSLTITMCGIAIGTIKL